MGLSGDVPYVPQRAKVVDEVIHLHTLLFLIISASATPP